LGKKFVQVYNVWLFSVSFIVKKTDLKFLYRDYYVVVCNVILECTISVYLSFLFEKF